MRNVLSVFSSSVLLRFPITARCAVSSVIKFLKAFNPFYITNDRGMFEAILALLRFDGPECRIKVWLDDRLVR